MEWSLCKPNQGSGSLHLVIDDGLHLVEARGEGLEFDGLGILDLHLGRLVKVLWHFAVLQRVHKDVKGTDRVEQGKVTDSS